MNKYLNVYFDSEGNKVFRYHVPSLSSLVGYLKETPVCRESFSRICSEESSAESQTDYGESLEETLNHLISGYADTYAEYRQKCHIDSLRVDTPIDYTRARTVHSYVGNRVDIQAFVDGRPRNMIKKERIAPKNQINFNYDLSFKAIVTDQIIMNRGMIAMTIIKALEQSNFNVNLNCFVLVHEKVAEEKHQREILYLTINLKDMDLPLNELKCVGPMMRIEFYRRCIFRLIETTPVDRVWNIGYGWSFRDDERDKILKPGIDDITFGNPLTMGIEGKDFNEDLERTIDYLNLGDLITLRKRLK